MKRNGEAPSGAQRWRCGRVAPAPRIPTTWRPGARGLRRLAALARDAGRYAGRGRTFRRGPPRSSGRYGRCRRWWTRPSASSTSTASGARLRGAHSLQRRARAVVAPRAPRRPPRGALFFAHRPARHGGHRRRQRLRWRSRPNGRGRGSRDACSTRSARSRGIRRRGPLQAGVELYALARSCCMETLQQADWWVERFMQWCEFLVRLPRAEKPWSKAAWPTPTAGCARRGRGLVRLVNAGTLFTYPGPGAVRRGRCPPPTTASKGA